MNFDLNIGNYSIEELTDMFDLPTNFDKNMVEIKETQTLERSGSKLHCPLRNEIQMFHK